MGGIDGINGVAMTAAERVHIAYVGVDLGRLNCP